MNKDNLLDYLPHILLLGPGPSSVAPSTYHALSQPTLGHLDTYLYGIMDEVKAGLRELFGTQNELTIATSGTGSSGMEAAFTNVVEPGDKVLVLANGFFATRMTEVAGRLGAKVTQFESPWGEALPVDQVAEQLGSENYDIVAMVQAETSTGVLNPAGEIGALLKDYGALFIIDAVTSLGGLPLQADEWGADVVYSCSQKGLACPPGLAPITFSARALAKYKGRKNKVPNWYLDAGLLAQYWGGEKRVYHHTISANLVYGLYQAVYNILAEGTQNAFARQWAAHEYLVRELYKLGLEMLVAEGQRLPMLNAVKVPAGADEAAIRARLRQEHHIEIGAGLGPLAGQIFRIGLMGHNARPEVVDKLITALKAVL
ncbi:MAG: alanine--glyoxylate aminotransferase family protein [Clostridiales bacterium]|nr:alanine--glyoxylate aminotransferase family protein [Clostridiales bacterium]